MDLILKIYDKKGKTVVREVEGETYDLMFGTIQNIMDLLEITEDMDSFALFKKVTSCYWELVDVLNDVFPDVTEDEWKCVKLKELIPLLLNIFKFSLSEILTIPTNSKNKPGA